MHAQLGAILDSKDTERPLKSPTATFEELGAKAGSQEQKEGTRHAPCIQEPRRWPTHLSHPLADLLDNPYPHPI